MSGIEGEANMCQLGSRRRCDRNKDDLKGEK